MTKNFPTICLNRIHRVGLLNMSLQSISATVKYRKQLRDLGYRFTRPREAVLRTLFEADHPMTASEVFEQLKQDRMRIDLATVYRNLHVLIDLGLVVQLGLAYEGQSRYVWAEGRGHVQYVQCEHCGDTVSLPASSLKRLKDFIRDKTGFLVHLQSFQVNGLCPDCQ